MITDGKPRLFSRTRKEIFTLPHIVEQLSLVFAGKTLEIDGELYNHKLKNDFNKIASTIKRDEVHPDHKIIEYHIYDVVSDKGYAERTREVFSHLHTVQAPNLKVVDTYAVRDRAELNKMHDRFTAEGYEGVMYRSQTMGYGEEGDGENRTVALLKVKKFTDSEFRVIAAIEGNGKFAGKLGKFVCELKNGNTFDCAMNGELETLEDYLINFDDYKGRMLTVQYQGFTPDGKPRFPRGLRFREEL
jgi:ATP-dependent DNA ligase